MAQVRVQVRFDLAPVTDLNHAMNTFHFFDVPTAYPAHRDDAVAAVRAFFESPPSGLAQALGAQMTDSVLRLYEVRAYDLSEPPPRTPSISSGALPAALYTGTRMPYEVAMVLSYHGVLPASRREKGRIYIAGVHEGWMEVGSTLVPPRFRSVAASPMDVAIEAARQLSLDSAAWSVRSTASAPPQYTRIAGGYVNFEPDTQRRRGYETDDRLSWSNP